MTTILGIQRHVAASFGISFHDMMSSRRYRLVVRPRQVAMYLSRRLTRHSLTRIGGLFGNKDRTTVRHAVHHIDVLMNNNDEFRDIILVLRSQLECRPDEW